MKFKNMIQLKNGYQNLVFQTKGYQNLAFLSSVLGQNIFQNKKLVD
jgi:hypothetical protein